MAYRKCKVYYDGSHYIGIPPQPKKPRPKKGAKVKKEVPELEELDAEDEDCPFDKPVQLSLFDNNGDILPGTYAEIFLLTEGKTEAIAIPEKALVEESGIYYIYLRIHDDIYRRQQVTTGRNDGERVEILTGVAPGDEVVTDGVHQLKQAALGNIIPEGHTHAH